MLHLWAGCYQSASLPQQGHSPDKHRPIIVNFVNDRALAVTEEGQVAVGWHVAEVPGHGFVVVIVEAVFLWWPEQDDCALELRRERGSFFQEDIGAERTEHDTLSLFIEVSIKVEVERQASGAPMLKASMAHSGESGIHGGVSFHLWG